MKMTTKARDKDTVVLVGESIFPDLVQDFADQMKEAVAKTEHKLILDLGEVEMIASSGITTLVQAHSELLEKGGRLVLANCQPTVKKVFTLLGLHQVMTLVDSVDEALK